MFLRHETDLLYEGYRTDELFLTGQFVGGMGTQRTMMAFNAAVRHDLPLLYISMESTSAERLEEIVLQMNQTPARMLKLRHPKKPDIYEDAYAAAVAEEVPGVRQGILATAVRVSTFKPDVLAVPDPQTNWLHDF